MSVNPLIIFDKLNFIKFINYSLSYMHSVITGLRAIKAAADLSGLLFGKKISDTNFEELPLYQKLFRVGSSYSISRFVRIGKEFSSLLIETTTKNATIFTMTLISGQIFWGTMVIFLITLYKEAKQRLEESELNERVAILKKIDTHSNNLAQIAVDNPWLAGRCEILIQESKERNIRLNKERCPDESSKMITPYKTITFFSASLNILNIYLADILYSLHKLCMDENNVVSYDKYFEFAQNILKFILVFGSHIVSSYNKRSENIYQLSQLYKYNDNISNNGHL